MFHYYTFGENAKRGLILSAKMADAYNRFTQSFIDAQTRFREEHGRPWHYTEAIYMPFNGPGQLRNDDDMETYNRFARIAEKQYWIRNHILRLPIKEEHMTGDFLVKKF